MPIRKVASLIGLIVHAFTAVTYGQLYYRNLEKDKIKNLRLDNDDYNAAMVILETIKCEIKWWLENIEINNGKLIRQNPIDIWLQTDASLNGWGAECSQISIGGRWTVEESKNHINYLVLLAIFLGLKAFS